MGGGEIQYDSIPVNAKPLGSSLKALINATLIRATLNFATLIFANFLQIRKN